MEYTALFLNRSAVTQDTAGILFETDKIEEPKRFIKMEKLGVSFNGELPDLITGTGVEAADDRHPILPPKCREGSKVAPEPVGQIDIL